MYLSLLDTALENKASRSINAASVMAAGSVIKELSRGTKASIRKYMAMLRFKGSKRTID